MLASADGQISVASMMFLIVGSVHAGSLQFGEFRAIIIAEPDPNTLRGRKGKVACIGHTTWKTGDGVEMYIEAVNEGTLINCVELTNEDLDEFCLSIYEELRRRPDWKERWESLEIGVRIDVAISPLVGRRSFWVVEITRVFIADWFSEDIRPEPKYTLCEEFKYAICSYLSITREE